MNRYLPHVIADIKAAHNIEEAETEVPSQSLEEHFAEIDRMVSEDGEQSLGYFYGLITEDFSRQSSLLKRKSKKYAMPSKKC